MIITLTDIETTGLDCNNNEIIEIGAVQFDSITLKEIDTFNVKVLPKRPENISKEAQKVNGYTKERWSDAVKLDKAINDFSIFGKGTHFAAYNFIFDWKFLEKVMDVDNIFNRLKIDILSIAIGNISHKDLRWWSLKSVCMYLKIEPEPEIHEALNGARCEYEVYKKLVRK